MGPFINSLIELFPDAPKLAVQRALARGHTIFFDKEDGKTRLFGEDLIWASLIILKDQMESCSWEIQFTRAEEDVLQRYKITPKKRQ